MTLSSSASPTERSWAAATPTVAPAPTATPTGEHPAAKLKATNETLNAEQGSATAAAQSAESSRDSLQATKTAARTLPPPPKPTAARILQLAVDRAAS